MYVTVRRLSAALLMAAAMLVTMASYSANPAFAERSPECKKLVKQIKKFDGNKRELADILSRAREQGCSYPAIPH